MLFNVGNKGILYRRTGHPVKMQLQNLCFCNPCTLGTRIAKVTFKYLLLLQQSVLEEPFVGFPKGLLSLQAQY